MAVSVKCRPKRNKKKTTARGANDNQWKAAQGRIFFLQKKKTKTKQKRQFKFNGNEKEPFIDRSLEKRGFVERSAKTTHSFRIGRL